MASGVGDKLPINDEAQSGYTATSSNKISTGLKYWSTIDEIDLSRELFANYAAGNCF
jgi:hypothetical protein